MICSREDVPCVISDSLLVQNTYISLVLDEKKPGPPLFTETKYDSGSNTKSLSH